MGRIVTSSQKAYRPKAAAFVLSMFAWNCGAFIFQESWPMAYATLWGIRVIQEVVGFHESIETI